MSTAEAKQPAEVKVGDKKDAEPVELVSLCLEGFLQNGDFQLHLFL